MMNALYETQTFRDQMVIGFSELCSEELKVWSLPWRKQEHICRAQLCDIIIVASCLRYVASLQTYYNTITFCYWQHVKRIFAELRPTELGTAMRTARMSVWEMCSLNFLKRSWEGMRALQKVSVHTCGWKVITIDIENQNNILFVAPGNLYLRLTVSQQTSIAGAGKGTAAALEVQDVKTYVYQKPVLATGSVIDSTQRIALFELYTNNLFVNPEIHQPYRWMKVHVQSMR